MEELTLYALFAGCLGWIAATAVIALILQQVLKTKILPPFIWWLGLFISLCVFLPAPEAVVSQFGQLTWVSQIEAIPSANVPSLALENIESEYLQDYGLLSFLSAIALVSLWRLRRLYRNYQRVYQMVADSVPVSSHVCQYPVYLTPFKESAFVIGLCKPVIALPDYFFKLSSEQQVTVLAHEQTHLKYSDQRAKLVWRVVIELFWFNPFLTFFEKGFNQSMEHRCDKQTLKEHNFVPCEYARTLLQCLKLSGDICTADTVVGFSADRLAIEDYKTRIKLIMADTEYRIQYKRVTILLAGLVSCIISVNSAFAAFWMLQEQWIYPVTNPRLTSGFGHIAKLRAYKPHKGIDLRGAKGTPIYASGSGKVMLADDESLPGGYGKVVVIQHPAGWQSLYAHLDDILVQAGDTVQQGGIIGTMGETGRASGVHLHFELALEGKPVDPMNYIGVPNERKSFKL